MKLRTRMTTLNISITLGLSILLWLIVIFFSDFSQKLVDSRYSIDPGEFEADQREHRQHHGAHRKDGRSLGLDDEVAGLYLQRDQDESINSASR